MRRTKEEAEATRNKIIEAAIELFETEGYAATRIEDIAEKTGMTRGAVYWHFKNKEELYISIFEMFEKRLDRLLQESRLKTSSPLQQLRWLITHTITRHDILVGMRQMKMIAISEFKLIKESERLQKKCERTTKKFMSALERIIVMQNPQVK